MGTETVEAANTIDWYLISTFVMAIATAIYATLTVFILLHMKRVRKEETEPDVRVSPSIGIGGKGRIELFMVVENTGKRPAYDVRIEFTPPLVGVHGLIKAPVITTLTDCIPPKVPLPIRLGRLAEYLKNDRCHKQYDVAISFSQKTEKMAKRIEHKIDIEAMEGLNFPTFFVWVQQRGELFSSIGQQTEEIETDSSSDN